MNRLLFSAALLLLAACGADRASPAVDPDRIYDISEVDVKPRMRNREVLAERLQRLRTTEATGTAFCEFVVERDGTATHVRLTVSSNIRELDSAAVEVHRSARWTPGSKGGIPVRVRAEAPVSYANQPPYVANAGRTYGVAARHM